MKPASLTACLCLLLALGPEARAEPEPVQDLAYGEGLFLYFKDDYFGAVTRLLAAQTRNELPDHADDAELLLGGLHLSYGQQDVASAIFERLLDESVSPAVRDRAWFYVGKMAYQRGLPDQAEQAFEGIGDALPEDLEAERRLIQAQVLMQQERFGEAVELLDDWEGPRDWLAYARYHLGVALVRHGRTEDGVRLLADIGEGEVVSRARWKTVFVPWRLFGRRHRGGGRLREGAAVVGNPDCVGPGHGCHPGWRPTGEPRFHGHAPSPGSGWRDGHAGGAIGAGGDHGPGQGA